MSGNQGLQWSHLAEILDNLVELFVPFQLQFIFGIGLEIRASVVQFHPALVCQISAK